MPAQAAINASCVGTATEAVRGRGPDASIDGPPCGHAPTLAKTPARIRMRRRRTRMPLKDWSSLPDYLQDNEYIKKYYRVDQTLSQTLWSLFTLHNETGNVWTHLIGAVIFTVLTVVTIVARPAPVRLATEHLSSLESRFLSTASGVWQAGKSLEASLRFAGGQMEHQLRLARQQIEGMLSAAGRDGASALHELEGRLRGYGESRLHDLLVFENWLLQHKSPKGMETAISHGLVSVVDLQWPSKRWPIHIFTFGAMFCLATSTLCHLLSSANLKFAQTIWRYDYAGIVVLIVTSFVPVVYYSFLCNPALQYFYLISTCLLGFLTITVSLMSTFQSPEYRAFRATLFAALGLWGIVPGVHALLLYGASHHLQKAVALDVLMGAFYLGGAGLFAARIPERFYPGHFDLFFNSHQIFHCAVVVAALLHYAGVRILLNWRDSTGGCTLPFTELIAASKNGTA